ncbi:MAG: ATP-binding cassette domain-containing protein, partial [Oscillospiraceae bacterium]
NKLIRDVSFTVRAGEIVGVAGLVGSGRSELLKTIYGVYKVRKGRIMLNGKICIIDSPEMALRHGIAMVPENRKSEGLILDGTVKENIVLSVLGRISKFDFVSRKAINGVAAGAIKYFEIRTPSKNQKIIRLSGGNQQKAIFARIAEIGPKILLLDEPTRGIDIGSKVDIYNKILDFAEKGTAIVLVSSDLTDILGMSDRVLVMKEGKMVAEMETRGASSKAIMDYATGGR